MLSLIKVFLTLAAIAEFSLLQVQSTFGLYRRVQFPAEVERIAKLRSIVDYGKNFGFNIERHKVSTSDGYTIQFHRLAVQGGKPMFIMHGLCTSSSSWLLLGPNKPALPYLLQQQGYDVWLGNTRGNPYGLRHANLSTKSDSKFWAFSWHEIGLYDLPAQIDYILNVTKTKQLSYIGHSQGATVFMVMASMLPQYNQKIKIMHAMAPAVFMGNVRSALFRNFGNSFQQLKYPYLGIFDLKLTGFENFCLASQFSLDTCLNAIGQLIGNNVKNFDKSMLPVYFQHFPVPSSILQLAHYYQNHWSGTFGTLDVDYIRSRKRLKSTPYPLKNITAPVALYYASNDLLAVPADVRRLKSELKNVFEDYLVPDSKWNHMDFVIGLNANEKLYKQILKVQKNFEDLK